MENFPSVAIVILNYNGAHYLQQFLPAVLASTYPNKRIIVADNASTDQSITVLQNNFPQVEVLINQQNDGFAGGYNWALQQIKSTYYILLNSDVAVTPRWVEPIITLMESDNTIAACQPKLLSYHTSNKFEYAGACGGWMDALGYPFARGRVFDYMETDSGQYNNTMPIFWASGAALFIKSSVFHTLNGFTASFFAHQEEIELCWRIQLSGYKIYVCPQSVVYHVGAGTLQKGGRKIYLNFRNNLMMLVMHLPPNEKYWKLLLRFFLDALSAWKSLLNGDIAFFIAVAKAHGYILTHLNSVIVEKQTKKPLKSLQGVYSGSIIWQYFLKRKKTFAEIVEKKRS
ncbi:glycosyltransferase family 2 protein [Hydrotalea sp.]|uniref:glycosyltransferase family 2 protein n=1 Tax=Hydrotalea sp. TaxID=2881279 RepID=UPI0026226845|nr:glycosyltransferase family 2 protein [Hydrotalea sp.]